MRKTTDKPEVIPQPGERWLMRHGGRCFAIPAELGRRMRDGEVVEGLEKALADPEGRLDFMAKRTLWPKLPLLPGRWVSVVAFALRGLASWWVLSVSVIFGCASYLVAAEIGAPVSAGIDWFALIAGLLCAGLVHELGHAAALSYGGGRPGAIGLGLMFIFPVLYCDVTAVSVLNRRSRLRVDVAGVTWHLALGGGLAVAGASWDMRTLTLISWGVLAAVVWSLLPFLQTDGYWLMCDLLGVRSLESATKLRTRGSHRAVLIAWRAGSLLFMGFIAAALVGRWVWLSTISSDWRTDIRICVLITVGVIGLGVANGLLRRTVILVRELYLDVLS